MGAKAWSEVAGPSVAFRMSHVVHALADRQAKEGQVRGQSQAGDLPWVGASERPCVEAGLLDGWS
eukprot:4383464-Alexandrium_andersonii.AAC.1